MRQGSDPSGGPPSGESSPSPVRRPRFRHYVAPQSTPRERLVQIAVGAAVAVTFLLVLVAVLWAFVRAPLATFAGLLAVWAIGMGILLVKRARERARRQLERELQRLGKWGQR